MKQKDYNKKLFNDEYYIKDESKKFYAGIIFFLILGVTVISIWAHFENIKVAEEQKKIEENNLAWQKYYQDIEYQKQQQYYQQQQSEYKRKMNEYNNTITRIQQTPISIDN